MLFNIGKYEIFVIVIVGLFLFAGVPAMGYLLSRGGAGSRQRLVRAAASVRALWRAWRA
ncbi:MAG TPA: hypothetical protein PKX48_04910 [Planctomycetota bacterium]|jgi:hypothetical protein|nr:hypothetical protein [Planctomycetota bacterium]OQC21841.1 MAG: hypothetical protein BWX69_00487 [Planctomycetes bacterium ADurb.Bin069]HNR98208.1 hypothetical protein [Planctomycetota bacterium]HNU24923.1 hypothetical protein [Planctomycetota bacterium]HOE29525.1 hypothetical protein [Planctomycetota bacterium]